MTDSRSRAAVDAGQAGATTPPDLSVVVPSVNGSDDLLPCLDALHRQNGGLRLEILVPERCGEAVQNAAITRFPRVRLIPVSADTTIPEMRRIAFDEARAGSVAVIEDHVIVPPDWARRMLDAREQGHTVVGGSVSNLATETLVDRTAFLCEYGHMLTPQPPGPAPWLTGNNVIYDRELLIRFRHVIEEGAWENRLHDAVRDAGVTLTSRPEIRVGHRMHYPRASAYAGQRFLYSRAYAGMRAAGMGPLARLAYAAGTSLLPAVVLFRIVRRGWVHQELRRDVIRGLPLLAYFAAAWGLGETVGALIGPGNALQRVC